jgi:hypothetical protein
MTNLIINPSNPFGVVMAYVLEHGRDDLIRLFIKYNIPSDPTPAEILHAIRRKGIKFLHEFDVTILRPYSRQMIAEMQNTSSFGGRAKERRAAKNSNPSPAVEVAAQDMASNQKNPNKLQNILAGLGGAFNVGLNVVDTINTIKGNNQPAPAPGPVYVNNPAPAKTDEDAEKKKQQQMYLYIGGGLLVAVVLLFLFMQMKKK